MVPEFGSDQADGLRRLFRRAPPPVIAFAGGTAGSGATWVACSFARGLAARGIVTTLIDEHRGAAGATAVLNARARFDLWQVVNGDARIGQAVVAADQDLWLVPAARLAQRETLETTQQSALERCWRALCGGSQVIVIDALHGSGGSLSPLAVRAASLVMVTGADSAAVMGCYLALKGMALVRPDLRMGLVVNRAPDAARAASIAGNLRALLSDQLGQSIEDLGWLPRIPAGRRGAVLPSPAALPGLNALLPEPLRDSFDPALDAGYRNFSGGTPLTRATAA